MEKIYLMEYVEIMLIQNEEKQSNNKMYVEACQ